jgi:hypothetical protein
MEAVPKLKPPPPQKKRIPLARGAPQRVAMKTVLQVRRKRVKRKNRWEKSPTQERALLAGLKI